MDKAIIFRQQPILHMFFTGNPTCIKPVTWDQIPHLREHCERWAMTNDCFILDEPISIYTREAQGVFFGK